MIVQAHLDIDIGNIQDPDFVLDSNISFQDLSLMTQQGAHLKPMVNWSLHQSACCKELKQVVQEKLIESAKAWVVQSLKLNLA